MVSIKRGGQILIPRGHTQLQVGDVITVYGRLKDIDGIRNFLNTCTLPSQTS
jgi:CIC family chloride channel protein